MSEWPGSISAISLFVGDLDASRTFYQRVFGLPVHFADADSVVFRLGDTLINLLIERAVPEVIAPASLAPPGAGAQFQFTVNVDDVRHADWARSRTAQWAYGPPLGHSHGQFRRSGWVHMGDRLLVVHLPSVAGLVRSQLVTLTIRCGAS